MKRMSRVISILAMALMAFGTTPAANAALKTVGPVDAPSPPGHGFPVWYQDTNSLALEVCLDPVNAFCLQPIPVPNSALPVVFPTNFPDEGFYWTADADVTLPNGSTASLIQAMEFAFGAGPVSIGDQVTFFRIRIRMLTPPVPGTYTFTMPYGVHVVDVPATGIRNEGFDIGLAPAPFDAVTRVFTPQLPTVIDYGPFLRWTDPDFPVIDAASGKRFVGNPAIPHAVTGSPFGTNIFRVQGPPGSGIDVQTNLFLVSGMIIGMDVKPSTNLNLGATNIVTPAALPQTVTVTNTTGASILFPALVTAGADAADFIIAPPTQPAPPAAALTDCSGASLAPAATCGFDVTFIPAAVAKGARVATIALAPTTVQPVPPVTPAVADPPPVTMNLTGTAVVSVTATPVSPHGTIVMEPTAIVTPAGTAPAGTAVTFAAAPSNAKFKVQKVEDGVTLLGAPNTPATLPNKAPFTLDTGAVDHAVTATFMPSGDLDADGALGLSDALKALRVVAGVQQADVDDPDNSAVKVAPLVNGIPSAINAKANPDIGDVLVILRRVLNIDVW